MVLVLSVFPVRFQYFLRTMSVCPRGKWRPEGCIYSLKEKVKMKKMYYVWRWINGRDNKYTMNKLVVLRLKVDVRHGKHKYLNCNSSLVSHKDFFLCIFSTSWCKINTPEITVWTKLENISSHIMIGIGLPFFNTSI